MNTRLSFAAASIISLYLATAINASAQSAPKSSTEVLYVTDSGGVETYDVDPQTGIPTDEGFAVLEPVNINLTPSLNDHYIYVIGNNPGTGALQLWSYATNSVALPQNPPLQQMNFESQTSNFIINPNETLAYAVQSSKNSQGEALAGIRVFSINPKTGIVTKSPKIAATYPPNGPCGSGTEAAGLGIIGFNSAGTEMYEEWGCQYYDTSQNFYYSRRVDQQTGALGPETQTFTTNDTNEGFDLVNFTPSALLDYNVPNDFNQYIDSLNVYPLTGGTSPIFSCTASMLAACGNSLYENVDPSGNYIFFQTGLNETEVTKPGTKGDRRYGFHVPRHCHNLQSRRFSDLHEISERIEHQSSDLYIRSRNRRSYI